MFSGVNPGLNVGVCRALSPIWPRVRKRRLHRDLWILRVACAQRHVPCFCRGVDLPVNTPASLPRLNEPAPDFVMHTTHGLRSLEDYVGRWLVLFSHPADFTPVCTSEFIAFAEHQAEFAACGCDLLGLSVDSAYSHIAWVQAIKERFGVEIGFPIGEDVAMRVARAYGMIHPGESDTSAVRATFVIDPDGVLRAILYYPMTTGRNVAEILRLVRALAVTANERVATPAGWRPGDAVLEPAPTTLADAEGRGPEAKTWFYKELPRS
jgi:peroxiredoxin (alkyl hydroperoxide reductase subunit C)